MDPGEQIAAWAAGGTSVISAVVYFTVSAVKGAIVTVVQQAAQRELAKLNAQLAAQLETNRQDFARDMAKVQQAITFEVERFKTELTFEVEKRRALVLRRLDAIDAVYAAGLHALRVMHGDEVTDPPDEGIDRRHEQEVLELFEQTLLATSHILTSEFEQDVRSIVIDYRLALDTIHGPFGGTKEDAMMVNALHKRLAARLREELAKPWVDIK